MERSTLVKIRPAAHWVICLSVLILLSGLVKAQAQARAALKGQEILRVRIGSGPEELGVITPEEANPEGPMSFAVGPGGEIYVLDQTNSRIQVFKDGRHLMTIPIPGAVFIYIELLPGGLIALLDDVVDKVIVILDQTGQVVRKVSLAQEEIPEPGGITGIYCRTEGLWPGLLAQADSNSILLAGPEGCPASRIMTLPGILNWSGLRLLKLEMEGDRLAAVLKLDQSFQTWKKYRASFSLPVGRIYGIWEDEYENIYLAANIFHDKKEANEVVIFEPGGRELARISLAVSRSPHEINNPVRVTPDGSIYQLVLEDQSVVIRKYND
ncbi:MAG: hypothetical protein ACUVRL_06840 [Candidatus Saccharicenans sp.]|uniref:hypothetical protein n=1 Tax=Candidatus Saccharicenans sp. TaxID=2819258 RepID=UPI00404A72AB